MRPRPGSGVESVTITTNGEGVRFTADGRTERVG
jgi:hypothetical protein